MPRVNPPAPLITGDVFRFTVNYEAGGVTANTTHDYMAGEFTSNPGLVLSRLLGVFADVVVDHFLPALPETAKVPRIFGAVISRSDIRTNVAILNELGILGPGYLPSTVAACLPRISALKGQHGQGRFYMPFVPSGLVDSADFPNQLNLEGATRYLAVGTQARQPLLDGFGVSAANVISTRPAEGSLNVLLAAVVFESSVDSTLATMRSRRLGRGI